MIRVLVVDDSSFMRKAITRMLESDSSIKVVGQARDGLEALELVEKLKPDVITLDVEMPRMDGIETLKRIMESFPTPVIMFSALTKEGAEVTLKALELGAVDFIAKDFSNVSISIHSKENELLTKVKSVARNRLVFVIKRLRSALKSGSNREFQSKAKVNASYEVLSIGASTGGPQALQMILSELPKDFPIPVVIAQHMPKIFTKSFSERLDTICEIRVKEAENREPLRPGVAYLAPGDSHMGLKKTGSQVFVELIEDGKFVYRPSVDVLMSSVAEIYENRAIAVILTGMGSDGKEGIRKIFESGGYVIAQDEDTSVVFGMPKAVIEAGFAKVILPIESIAKEVLRLVFRE